MDILQKVSRQTDETLVFTLSISCVLLVIQYCSAYMVQADFQGESNVVYNEPIVLNHCVAQGVQLILVFIYGKVKKLKLKTPSAVSLRSHQIDERAMSLALTPHISVVEFPFQKVRVVHDRRKGMIRLWILDLFRVCKMLAVCNVHQFPRDTVVELSGRCEEINVANIPLGNKKSLPKMVGFLWIIPFVDWGKVVEQIVKCILLWQSFANNHCTE